MPLLIDDRWINAEEWERCTAWLCWNRAGQRRDHDHSSLGLPTSIDDRAAPAAYLLMIPHPSLGINRFADCAEQTKRRKIMFCHPFVSPANKRADRRRCRIKNVDPMFLDDLPDPIRLGPVRSALVHDNRRAVR